MCDKSNTPQTPDWDSKIPDAIDEMLLAAYKYDDKPHKLYWRILDIARLVNHEDIEEIERLMNKAAGS